jgi:hypothetical protein
MVLGGAEPACAESCLLKLLAVEDWSGTEDMFIGSTVLAAEFCLSSIGSWFAKADIPSAKLRV